MQKANGTDEILENAIFSSINCSYICIYVYIYMIIISICNLEARNDLHQANDNSSHSDLTRKCIGGSQGTDLEMISSRIRLRGNLYMIIYIYRIYRKKLEMISSRIDIIIYRKDLIFREKKRGFLKPCP